MADSEDQEKQGETPNAEKEAPLSEKTNWKQAFLKLCLTFLPHLADFLIVGFAGAFGGYLNDLRTPDPLIRGEMLYFRDEWLFGIVAAWAGIYVIAGDLLTKGIIDRYLRRLVVAGLFGFAGVAVVDSARDSIFKKPESEVASDRSSANLRIKIHEMVAEKAFNGPIEGRIQDLQFTVSQYLSMLTMSTKERYDAESVLAFHEAIGALLKCGASDPTQSAHSLDYILRIHGSMLSKNARAALEISKSELESKVARLTPSKVLVATSVDVSAMRVDKERIEEGFVRLANFPIGSGDLPLNVDPQLVTTRTQQSAAQWQDFLFSLPDGNNPAIGTGATDKDIEKYLKDKTLHAKGRINLRSGYPTLDSTGLIFQNSLAIVDANVPVTVKEVRIFQNTRWRQIWMKISVKAVHLNPLE